MLDRSSPKVSIVLLNLNGYRDTRDCLESLQRVHYPNFDVILVDNGSSDDSFPRLQKEFPEAKLLRNQENLGFAGGCNLGITHALREGAEYVWLLNNDTTVDSGALWAMVEKADTDPMIGAVGSAIYSMEERERIQVWGGGYVDFLLGRSRHFTAPVSDEKLQFITGASFLVRRRTLEELGLLDEGFFMYWEDADYCFNLRRAGWRLAVARDSRVWHKEQGSIGKKSALLDTYFNRSARRFFEKNSLIPFIPIWAGITLRIAKRAIIGDWKRARAVWAGVKEAEKACKRFGS